jgi:LPXTG-motif cell wall-anchored protein
MSGFASIFAQFMPDALLARRQFKGAPPTRETFLILGAIGLVTLLVAGWALFIRKKKRRRRSYDYHKKTVKTDTSSLNGNGSASPAKATGKERRRRRKHRRLNPTLAQTGGLPPIRPEELAEGE